MKKWWNTIVATGLIAVGCVSLVSCGGGQPVSSTGTVASSTTVPAPVTTVTVPEIIPGVASVRYENAQFGFSLERPQTSEVKTEGFEQYVPLTQTSVVAFTLPSELFKGTNLGEAGVYIGANSSPAIVAKWNQPLTEAGEVSVGVVEINGLSFAVFTSQDAGAGNFYEERIYRAVRNGTCFEIAELLHSTNIGNYDPGTVVEFDKAKFEGYLEAIVRTLSFSSN